MLGLFLNPRVILAIALAVFLAGVYWRGHQQGAKGVREEWAVATAQATAKALQASEAARAKEAVLMDLKTKAEALYEAEKKRRAAADSATADGVRRLNAALARDYSVGKNSTAIGGADADPRNRIIAECADTVGRLDQAARGMAGQLAGLQGYVAGVCVSK